MASNSCMRDSVAWRMHASNTVTNWSSLDPASYSKLNQGFLQPGCTCRSCGQCCCSTEVALPTSPASRSDRIKEHACPSMLSACTEQQYVLNAMCSGCMRAVAPSRLKGLHAQLIQHRLIQLARPVALIHHPAKQQSSIPTRILTCVSHFEKILPFVRSMAEEETQSYEELQGNLAEYTSQLQQASPEQRRQPGIRLTWPCACRSRSCCLVTLRMRSSQKCTPVSPRCEPA